MKYALYTLQRERSLICIISYICSDAKGSISKGLLSLIFNNIINTHSVRLSAACPFDVGLQEAEVVVNKLLSMGQLPRSLP